MYVVTAGDVGTAGVTVATQVVVVAGVVATSGVSLENVAGGSVD
jgi:hypothetical protein